MGKFNGIHLRTKKSDISFSQKEIGIAINNAVQASLNPQNYAILETRLRKLREYSHALVEPITEHITGEVDEETGNTLPPTLRPEEAVVILLTSALYFHIKHVVGTEKLPTVKIAELLFEEDHNGVT